MPRSGGAVKGEFGGISDSWAPFAAFKTRKLCRIAHLTGTPVSPPTSIELPGEAKANGKRPVGRFRDRGRDERAQAHVAQELIRRHRPQVDPRQRRDARGHGLPQGRPPARGEGVLRSPPRAPHGVRPLLRRLQWNLAPVVPLALGEIPAVGGRGAGLLGKQPQGT